MSNYILIYSANYLTMESQLSVEEKEKLVNVWIQNVYQL